MAPLCATTTISAKSAALTTITATKTTVAAAAAMAIEDAIENATTATAEAVQPRRISSNTLRIMSCQQVIAMLVLILCGLATVNGLRCHMCGAYNEGVGSITPCLNYSEQYAHLYLKECSKKTEKFCVKYVSELSTVRDCATECSEKEIWETQTYCCDKDGCNGSGNLEITFGILLLPFVCVFCQLFKACKYLNAGR